MKKTILICAIVAALCGLLASADSTTDTERQILALERQAMDGWLQGNPDALLALTDPQITYFHVVTDKRIDGLSAVRALFEQYRGKPLFDSYEILDPRVQVGGDMVVLTYQLVTRNADVTRHWNATQVYQQKKEGWRIIHSHWSLAKPPAAAPPQP